jgi:hypothetical protein
LHIEKLLLQLRDDIWFVLEFPYVDSHYRDNYYAYYASKFKNVDRDCIRIHLFEGPMITRTDLLKKDTKPKDDPQTSEDFPVEKEQYLGFFIVRPLPQFPLGRSLISPKALKKNDFVCCLIRDKVSLVGHDFEVSGFPHVAQDTETHSCAESSLWSFTKYFGSKYSQYKSLLPSQIAKSLINVLDHRVLPSIGLTEKELARCLQDNEYQCLKYQVARNSNKSPAIFLLKTYIESGIPVLLFLSNNHDGHALLAIGHFGEKLDYSIPCGKKWVDVSSFDKKLILIDDNMPPYQVADINAPTAHYPNEKLKDLAIKSFIVPLPPHMFLACDKAFTLVGNILNDPQVGLQRHKGRWLTRLLLTSSQSFKNFLVNDKKLDDELKGYILFLSLPKFIWICELYEESNILTEICSGLIIIDATGSNRGFSSVLWYTVGNEIMTHNGSEWKGDELNLSFQLNTYKNNLKGDWCKWQG